MSLLPQKREKEKNNKNAIAIATILCTLVVAYCSL
jgi:hypothetical protein